MNECCRTKAQSTIRLIVYASRLLRVVRSLFNLLTTFMLFVGSQILIASIMCGYDKNDWTELAQMSEVSICYFCMNMHFKKYLLAIILRLCPWL